jgi:hypothetical protein
LNYSATYESCTISLRKLKKSLNYSPLEFEVGDHVYMRVSPMKGVQRFRVKRKLAPRYVGPYRILERKEEVV